MRGQDQLIALRMRRVAPAWVGVNAMRIPVCGIDESGNPWLHIEPGSNLGRLDLRCLVGLRAEVWATDEAWRGEVVAACVNAGAGSVYAFDPYNENLERLHG